MALIKTKDGERLYFRVYGNLLMSEIALKEILGQKIINNPDFEKIISISLKNKSNVFEAFGVDKDWITKEDLKSQMKKRTVNLSVAGIGFVPELKHNVGDYLLIYIDFPTSPEPLLMIGKVVNFFEKEVSGDINMGVEFLQSNIADEKIISQYVFARDRELVRKEKEESELEKAKQEKSGNNLSPAEIRRKEIYREKMQAKMNKKKW